MPLCYINWLNDWQTTCKLSLSVSWQTGKVVCHLHYSLSLYVQFFKKHTKEDLAVKCRQCILSSRILYYTDISKWTCISLCLHIVRTFYSANSYTIHLIRPISCQHHFSQRLLPNCHILVCTIMVVQIHIRHSLAMAAEPKVNTLQ